MDTVRWIKYRAKRLLKAHRAGDPSATERIRNQVRSMNHVHLQKVQHVVAVEMGFRHWKDMLDATDEERLARIEKVRAEEEGAGDGEGQGTD